jgi:heat shock protein HslJ
MNRFVIFIILLSFLGTVVASDRYIKIVSPDGNSMIYPDRPVTVSGTGKGLFEGNVVIRFEHLDGHLLIQEPATMHREDIAAAGEWETNITLPTPVPEALRLIAFSPSPKEGDAAITSTPVLLETRNAAAADLTGTRWVLSQYLNESGDMQPVIPDTVIDAQFDAGKVTGSAGCNRYFAGYTSGNNNRLLLDGRIGATQMACAQSVDIQERHYLALLAGVNSQEIRDGVLLLFDRQGEVVLQYVAESPLTLEDTRWHATGINNGRGGVVSSGSTQLATAVFTDGKVSGSAGCNNYSAGYEISDSQITTGPAMTTRRQCAEPKGIMAQEQQFLQALAAARQYSLTAERLELRDSNGSLQVVFSASAAE